MTRRPDRKRRPSRRDVLRILAVGGAAAATWKMGWLGGSALRPVTRSRVLMGTEVHLSVLDDDPESAAAAAEATLQQMSTLENLLSRYLPESEVSRLNATAHLGQASDALLDVLRTAEQLSRLGEGAFDVTVQPVLDLHGLTGTLPDRDAVEQAVARVDYRALRVDGRTITLDRPEMRITLDGIGKGYIIDSGVEVLQARGFHNVFVEAGGDLVANGDKGADGPWRIGIRNPRGGLGLVARFDARNTAVATSGDYMQPFTPDFRQHHIINPLTGYSEPELSSATVMAPSAALADGLATLCMVLGPQRGVAMLEDLPGCEGYLLSKSMGLSSTSGFSVV